MKETKRLIRRFINLVMSLFLMFGLLGTAGISVKAETKNIDEDDYFAINDDIYFSGSSGDKRYVHDEDPIYHPDSKFFWGTRKLTYAGYNSKYHCHIFAVTGTDVTTVNMWYYSQESRMPSGLSKVNGGGTDMNPYRVALVFPDSYNITYELNGAAWAGDPPASTYPYSTETATALPSGDALVYEARTFEGWYTDAEFTGEPVTQIAAGDSGDKTYYAKWSAPAVEYVRLDKESGNVDVNGVMELTAAAKPADSNVSWTVTSGNEHIALFSDAACETPLGTDPVPTGKIYIKGLSEGTATVTVTSVDDISKSASCTVKVNKVPVSEITLNKNYATLYAGGTEKLTAEVLPENATDKKVIWNVYINPNVVTLYKDEGCTQKYDPENDDVRTVYVKAETEGDAWIYVESADDGTKYADCQITVLPDGAYNIWIAGERVTDENKNDVLGDGKVSFDPQTNTLTLKDAEISMSAGYSAVSASKMDLTIKGTGIIRSTEDSSIIGLSQGIYLENGTLNISGDITVQSYDVGICVDKGDLQITGGTLNVTSSADDGITVNEGDISISAGQVSSNGYKDGIDADNINISGGEVEAKCTERGGDGLSADYIIRITGGRVVAESGKGDYDYAVLAGKQIDISELLQITAPEDGDIFDIPEWADQGNVPQYVGDSDGNAATYVVIEPAYTVTFDANGGSDVPSQTVIYNNKATSPDRPEKGGWYFGGWFTDEACTQEYDFNTPVTGDLTLYAGWYVVISYDSYDTPEGSPSKNSKVKLNDKEPYGAGMYYVFEGKELTLTPLAADGYRFVGWVGTELDATDSGKCFNTANPLKITSCSLDALKDFGRKQYADIGKDAYRAVALFEKIPTYTVTYKVVNGTWSDGTTADKTETVESGSKPTSVPTGMKANTGFTGGAWDTDPAGTEITQATTFTYTFAKTSAPAILTFDLKGGTLNGRSGIITINANVGDTVNLPAAPTREGYTFQYWKGSEYEAGARYKVTGDHTFTAEWKKADKETDDPKDGSSDSGKKTTPIKTDSVVTCQMAGYPANYSWNEAAKACQPGYTDAKGTFHSYRSAYKVVPNTYDRGLAGYALSLAISLITAVFCGFLLKKY